MKRFFPFVLITFFATASLSGNTDPAAGEPTEISWKTLRGFNLKTGKMSDMLTKLNGKAVKIPGFMVPLDDMDYESVGRFLLVPDPQACIHVPPPPANQMIFVVMKGKKKAPVAFGMPIMLTGDLKVKSIRSQFGVVSFQVAGESVKPYTGK
ncbi:MAG TPA: DUF3299 domain-containing protein [Turneriella sp.]|nr:DUF3299 domain-containing protein [Turneriella sp.]HMY10871.1 DUF3299 domain-containing protein [Turneriella sp.]HNE21222.1 DUF3299 domain-containing protein [Turneriella sp.]HNJ65794.1 DUF3299 domain-containing protein [Turneriella sp.]HNL11072.1 DUF3299 domain-containing protein [Turneriella sp.]